MDSVLCIKQKKWGGTIGNYKCHRGRGLIEENGRFLSEFRKSSNFPFSDVHGNKRETQLLSWKGMKFIIRK